MVSRVEKSEGEKKELDQFSFQVLRKKGTEPAGTGEYDKFYPTEGHFVCKGCGNPLYSAESKFNSGCGWCVARSPDVDFLPPRSTTPPPPGSTTILNVLLFRHPVFLHLSRPAFDKCYEGSIITETDMTSRNEACRDHVRSHTWSPLVTCSRTRGSSLLWSATVLTASAGKYVEGPAGDTS